jgi:hypothetical protein
VDVSEPRRTRYEARIVEVSVVQRLLTRRDGRRSTFYYDLILPLEDSKFLATPHFHTFFIGNSSSQPPHAFSVVVGG